MVSLQRRVGFTILATASRTFRRDLANAFVVGRHLQSPRPGDAHMQPQRLRSSLNRIFKSSRPSSDRPQPATVSASPIDATAAKHSARTSTVNTTHDLGYSPNVLLDSPVLQDVAGLNRTTPVNGAFTPTGQILPLNLPTKAVSSKASEASRTASTEQPSTASTHSDNKAADVVVTLSRRKHPQAFETGGKLRGLIDSKHLKSKNIGGPSVSSADELVDTHKAAEAQIRESKNDEAKNRKKITELRAENAQLRQQGDALEQTLNKRIVEQDSIVKKQCASREKSSDRLLQDSVAEVSRLTQELLGTKAMTHENIMRLQRENETIQRQGNVARQALKGAEKEIRDLKKQLQAQLSMKPRLNPRSRNAAIPTFNDTGPATGRAEPESEDDVLPQPQIARAPVPARSLRSSNRAKDLNELASDDTTQVENISSDAPDVLSSSPYKPSTKRSYSRTDLASSSWEADKLKTGSNKRGRLDNIPTSNIPDHEREGVASDEVEQRDKEAIRKASGLRGRPVPVRRR